MMPFFGPRIGEQRSNGPSWSPAAHPEQSAHRSEKCAHSSSSARPHGPEGSRRPFTKGSQPITPTFGFAAACAAKCSPPPKRSQAHTSMVKAEKGHEETKRGLPRPHLNLRQQRFHQRSLTGAQRPPLSRRPKSFCLVCRSRSRASQIKRAFSSFRGRASPREVTVFLRLAAKMAEGGCFLVDWPIQTQTLTDPRGARNRRPAERYRPVSSSSTWLVLWVVM